MGLNCTTAPNLAARAATDMPWVLITVGDLGPCSCWWCCPCGVEGVSVMVGAAQGNQE